MWRRRFGFSVACRVVWSPAHPERCRTPRVPYERQRGPANSKQALAWCTCSSRHHSSHCEKESKAENPSLTSPASYADLPLHIPALRKNEVFSLKFKLWFQFCKNYNTLPKTSKIKIKSLCSSCPLLNINACFSDYMQLDSLWYGHTGHMTTWPLTHKP